MNNTNLRDYLKALSSDQDNDYVLFFMSRQKKTIRDTTKNLKDFCSQRRVTRTIGHILLYLTEDSKKIQTRNENISVKHVHSEKQLKQWIEIGGISLIYLEKPISEETRKFIEDNAKESLVFMHVTSEPQNIDKPFIKYVLVTDKPKINKYTKYTGHIPENNGIIYVPTDIRDSLDLKDQWWYKYYTQNQCVVRLVRSKNVSLVTKAIINTFIIGEQLRYMIRKRLHRLNCKLNKLFDYLLLHVMNNVKIEDLIANNVNKFLQVDEPKTIMHMCIICYYILVLNKNINDDDGEKVLSSFNIYASEDPYSIIERYVKLFLKFLFEDDSSIQIESNYNFNDDIESSYNFKDGVSLEVGVLVCDDNAVYLGFICANVLHRYDVAEGLSVEYDWRGIKLWDKDLYILHKLSIYVKNNISIKTIQKPTSL
jgi:hypothetical protein